MITLWPSIARSLEASVATRDLALSLELKRATDGVLHFTAAQPVSKAAAHKLSDALSRHTNSALTIVIQHGVSGVAQRCYSDRTRGN